MSNVVVSLSIKSIFKILFVLVEDLLVVNNKWKQTVQNVALSTIYFVISSYYCFMVDFYEP
jgi:hypothetical protein